MRPPTPFLPILFLAALTNATCYYPDGSSDSTEKACTSGSGTSVCCSEGFECLSNGFCNDYRYENYTRVLRGACTDQKWGVGCPRSCMNIWPQGEELVYNCGSQKFCCGRSKDCCTDSSVQKFDFGTPSIIARAGKNLADPTAVSIITLAQSTTLPQTGVGASITTNTAASSSTSTASVETGDKGAGSESNTTAIAIGVGVGVGVFLFLLVAGVLLFMRRRKQKQGINAPAETFGHTAGPPPPVYEIGDAAGVEVAANEEEKRDWKSGWKGGKYGRGSERLAELDGNRGVEMDGKRDVGEVDGREVGNGNVWGRDGMR